MNKILVGLLALSIIGNTYLLMKPKKIELQGSEPEKVIVKEIETVTVEDETLKARNKELETELAKIEQELADSVRELELMKDRQALDEMSRELSNDKVAKAIEGGNDEAIHKKMIQEREDTKELFENESVDESWAYQTQDAITKAIHEHGDTTLYEIRGIVCKSTICKMSLKPFKDSKGAGMMAGMNASMSFNQDESLVGYKTMFHFDKGSGTEEVDVFITR